MALTDNLISYYKLDSNSNDSVGTNNGTDTSVSYVAGKIGNSGSFNGSTSIIKCPAASIRPTGNFTVNAWIKTSVTGTEKMIFETYSQHPPKRLIKGTIIGSKYDKFHKILFYEIKPEKESMIIENIFRSEFEMAFL